MAQYYNTHPSVITVPNVTDKGEAATEAISEFDKHHETLLSDDAEGWALELCRYLGTMQQDVKKDTMLIYIQHLHGLHLMSSHCKHHLCPANDYSPVPNKLPLTAEQVWVRSYLKKLPLQSQHGDLGLVTLQLGMLRRWKRLGILILSRCWLTMVIRRSGINLC